MEKNLKKMSEMIRDGHLKTAQRAFELFVANLPQGWRWEATEGNEPYLREADGSSYSVGNVFHRILRSVRKEWPAYDGDKVFSQYIQTAKKRELAEWERQYPPR